MSNVSTKKFQCPSDKRLFATARALAQHKNMVHGGNQTRNERKLRNAPNARGGRGGRGGRGRGGGNIPAPSGIKTTSGSTITVSGEDRISDFTVTEKDRNFKKVYIIDSSMTPRLTTLSRAYQRIKFISLKVTVTPQVSAFTNGGYIAGFIMDPDDTSISKTTLQASQGSVVKKWYESATVVMPPTNTLFYTSSGYEPRTRSPARFWIVVDFAPSTTLNVVLSLTWKVQLTHPTYEDDKEGTPSFFLEGMFKAYKDNYNALYFKDMDSKTVGISDTSSAYPDSIKHSEATYEFFEVNSFNIEYAEGTGDTGTIVCHFLAYRPADKKTYYSANGKDIITTPWQGGVDEQVFVPCGALMKYHNMCSGNKVAAEKLETHPSSHLVGLESLTKQIELLSSSLKKLEMRLNNSEKNSDNCGATPNPERQNKE